MRPSTSPRASVIDWTTVRRGLDAAERALREQQSPPADRAQAILAERARRLARPADITREAASDLEVVEFRLTDEHYAIESACLYEVRRFENFTPLRLDNALFKGLTNVRGDILPVFDLGPLFGLGQRKISDQCRILVVGGDRPEIGIVADRVEGTRQLASGALEPGPGRGPGDRLVRGLSREAVTVLDGRDLLTSEVLDLADTA